MEKGGRGAAKGWRKGRSQSPTRVWYVHWGVKGVIEKKRT